MKTMRYLYLITVLSVIAGTQTQAADHDKWDYWVPAKEIRTTKDYGCSAQTPEKCNSISPKAGPVVLDCGVATIDSLGRFIDLGKQGAQYELTTEVSGNFEIGNCVYQ